jgi:predicted membrane protein
MAVVFYQIGIFIAIQIAALFGKNARNTAIILITIFTLLQVFISWLLLLQLITIFISYYFSKHWYKKNNTTKKQKNNVLYSSRKGDGRAIIEVDLNDGNLEDDIRQKATLQNEIREYSKYKYENDVEYRNSVKSVLNNFSNLANGTNQNSKNKINPKTKFYYVSKGKTHGPVTANGIIHLVKTDQINRNCYVREVSEKVFEKRAFEIEKLLQKT